MTKLISVQVEVKADFKILWVVYTEPSHIVHWNFASDDWCCPTAEVDLRAGGHYSARMEARDGSLGFDFEAIFEEIVPYERIIYRIADGRKVIINFNQDEGSTHLQVIFEAENHHSVDQQRDGWQSILENFKQYIYSNLTK